MVREGPGGLSGLCPASHVGAPVCPPLPSCLWQAGSSRCPSLSALPPALLPAGASVQHSLCQFLILSALAARLTPAQICAKFCKSPALGRGDLTSGVGGGERSMITGLLSIHAVRLSLLVSLFPRAHTCPAGRF